MHSQQENENDILCKVSGIAQPKVLKKRIQWFPPLGGPGVQLPETLASKAGGEDF